MASAIFFQATCALRQADTSSLASIVNKHYQGNAHVTRGRDNKSLLHLACEDNLPAAVSFLLERGAIADFKCSTGETPLSVALANGHEEICRLLLAHGVSFKDPETPLVHTVLHSSLPASRQCELLSFLHTCGCSISEQDASGQTPLHVATKLSLSTQAAHLISLGAGGELEHFEGGCSPLHIAASSLDLPTLCVLCPTHTDVRAVDAEGKTPLALALLSQAAATIQQRADVLTLLIEAGADGSEVVLASSVLHPVSCKTSMREGSSNTQERRSALQVACLAGDNRLLSSCLASVSVDEEINPGKRPLWYALHSQQICSIELLITRGATPYLDPVPILPVNHTNILFLCAKSHSYSLLKNILPFVQSEHWAYLNSAGETLLHTLIAQGNPCDLVAHLLSHGCPVHLGPHSRPTALHYAIASDLPTSLVEQLCKVAEARCSASERAGFFNHYCAHSCLVSSHKINEGETALTLALRLEKWDVAMTLLKHGASAFAGHAQGRSPLFLLCKKGKCQKELVAALVEAGASVCGELLNYAIENSASDVVRLLLVEYNAPFSQEKGARAKLFSKSDPDTEICNIIGRACCSIPMDSPLSPCAVCSDRDATYTMLECGCNVCMRCLTGWFTSQANERVVFANMRCPLCLQQASVVDVLANVYDKRAMDMVERTSLELCCSTQPDFIWCPSCSSGGVLANTSCGEVECVCGFSFCAVCRRETHAGMTCEEYEDTDMCHVGAWRRKHARQCPRCHVHIEKNGGCPHMTCSQCVAHFCWNCMRLNTDHEGSFPCSQ